jgi:hypothetical protein
MTLPARPARLTIRSVVAMAAAVVARAATIALAQPPAPPAVPAVVAAVEERQLAAGQSFVGTVFPARVSAVVERVVRFPILDGQRVGKGEPTAEFLAGLLEIERRGGGVRAPRPGTRGAECAVPESTDLTRRFTAFSIVTPDPDLSTGWHTAAVPLPPAPQPVTHP